MTYDFVQKSKARRRGNVIKKFPFEKNLFHGCCQGYRKNTFTKFFLFLTWCSLCSDQRHQKRPLLTFQPFAAVDIASWNEINCSYMYLSQEVSVTHEARAICEEPDMDSCFAWFQGSSACLGFSQLFRLISRLISMSRLLTAVSPDFKAPQHV